MRRATHPGPTTRTPWALLASLWKDEGCWHGPGNHSKGPGAELCEFGRISRCDEHFAVLALAALVHRSFESL